jgi:hypothetical protein
VVEGGLLVSKLVPSICQMLESTLQKSAYIRSWYVYLGTTLYLPPYYYTSIGTNNTLSFYQNRVKAGDVHSNVRCSHSSITSIVVRFHSYMASWTEVGISVPTYIVKAENIPPRSDDLYLGCHARSTQAPTTPGMLDST